MFDFELGQTNEFNIGIHSFPAWRFTLKGQCGEQAGKFTSYVVGKGTHSIFFFFFSSIYLFTK